MERGVGALHLVGNGESERGHAARAAWAQLQGGATIRQSRDIVAALAATAAGPEVLVLLEPDPPSIFTALEARDRRGMPRWAVLPESVEDMVSSDFAKADWSVPLLARAILAAGALLDLRRENHRLRGDLATIGRRLPHDLRAPLAAITSAVQASDEPGVDATAAAVFRRAISTGVVEASDLIDRVARVLFASARPIVLGPVNMEEVLWQACDRLDGRVRAVGATIVRGSRWPAVNGVPAFVELIWTHLLSNSLQHGGPTPHITIGCDPVRPPRFWIRDNGPGVPKFKRGQLFYPFDRLNELSAPHGYGLSLVQRLVELQGGTTGYDPQPAPGGTFFFTLP
jgi:signal transduction histidine kinase